jgi:NADPH-dependent ferric siderophore reductase
MNAKMRMTEVLTINDISPHMRRITLTGDALTDFPEDKESAYVKAIFPDPNSSEKTPKLGFHLGFKKFMRSYTVRAFDKKNKTLAIDFAVNDHQGLATNWASQAKPGDLLGIAGPGDTKYPDLFAQKHLFFGDITALPAIAAILEQLNASAVGHAWIQVPTKQDIQQLLAPTGIEIHWLVTVEKLTDKFLVGLESQGSNLSSTAIFIAAEASKVKQLKAHLNSQCQYDKSKLYASAYWNQKK